jgi:hypothetical protein
MHKLIDPASVGLEIPDELLAIRPHMPFRELKRRWGWR